MMKSKYKIVALGGLEENGKNCYVFETEKDMVIVDYGLSNFNNKMIGIDHIICDLSYVIENKRKLRGILISHGHLDQMGGIAKLLNKIKTNVYASNYTISFLKGYVDKSNYKFLKEFRYDGSLRLGDIVVESFRLSHAIYGNLGFLLNFGNEAVVYATDYNFSQEGSEFARTDIKKIVRLANKYNIRALLSESVQINQRGNEISAKNIIVQMKRKMENASGRMIISVYSSNLAGMNNIINLSSELGKKIVIVGRDLLTYVNVAKEYGYLEPQRDLFIRINDMDRYDDKDLVIVVADLNSSLFSELERMALHKHNIVNMKATDTIMIASKPADEFEAYAQKVLDKISRTGADIISQKINVSSHAHVDDVKMLVNLFEPELVIPIKGEFRKFVEFRNVVKDLLETEEKVIFIQNGEFLEFFEKAALKMDKLKLQDEYIASNSMDSVERILLKDREVLSENGYLIIVLPLYKKSQQLAQKPNLMFSNGAEFMKENKLQEACHKIIEKELSQATDYKELINKIKIKVSRHIQNKYNKTIMVLPMKIEFERKNKGNNNGQTKKETR